MSLHKNIILKNITENNLKGIDVSIPLGSFNVICGPSGSGKSSLAFKTLYAEGQRRYIESLSNYSKQFIQKSPKPEVEEVHNIPPALALTQKNGVKNSRSTVGSHTELLDHLRVFYSQVGRAQCPTHNMDMQSFSPESIAEFLEVNQNNKRGYLICALPAEIPQAEKESLIKIIFKQGFEKCVKLKHPEWKKGHLFCKTETLERLNILDLLESMESIYLIVDRLAIDSKDSSRLFDSIRQALNLSLKINTQTVHGEVYFLNTENELYRFSEDHSCPICDASLPPMRPQLFSYNSPLGACSSCKGFGNLMELDEAKVVPVPSLSLAAGALKPLSMPSGANDFKKMNTFCKEHGINRHLAWENLSDEDKDLIWNGDDTWFGIAGLFNYLETKKYKMHVRVYLSRFKSAFACESCFGKRLRPEVNEIYFNSKNFNELCDLPFNELLDFFKQVDPKIQKDHKEVYSQIRGRLQCLMDVGLSYLSLMRETRTLSGGEFQRMNLAHQLGMGLSQSLFVLDEPTVGLHPRDNTRLIHILKSLHGLGNTLVVVEHDGDVIRQSERVLELGPGSGAQGGELLFDGVVKNFLKSKNSLTAGHLNKKQVALVTEKKKSQKWLSLTKAMGHNLKSVDLKIPLQQMTVVSGVSGSGKSSLIVDTLYRSLQEQFQLESKPSLKHGSLKGYETLKNIVLMDQSSAAKNARSTPATYLKVFDPIRELFADTFESKARGYKPGFFSLNVKAGGRCPTCEGLGYELIEMVFMDDLKLECESCKGLKFKAETLDVKFNGLNIHEVLNLTAQEALQFFTAFSRIRKPLNILKEVGMEYIKLGQSLSSLSGGENQRLKLSKYLLQSDFENTLFVLDEPTTGLHFREIELLTKLFHKMVDAGATLIVIEHNLDVIAKAHWVIDLGPEAGPDGGSIVYEGSPTALAQHAGWTGQYLKTHLT